LSHGFLLFPFPTQICLLSIPITRFAQDEFPFHS
jgi:hypothetical protein